MKQYLPDDKEAIIKRLMPPNPVSIPVLSKETGIPQSTLHTWKHRYHQQGQAIPATSNPPDHWPAQDKLAIVCESYSFKGTELSEYCRKKGLYPEQVEAWREAALKGYQRQEQLAKQQQEQAKASQQTIQQLQAELRRKEAALAETAALLVLSKKSQAIWGDNGGN